MRTLDAPSVARMELARPTSVSRVLGLSVLAVALGLCLPIASFLATGGSADSSFSLSSIPTSGGSTVWSSQVWTVEQAQNEAFAGSLRLLLALALTAWLSAFAAALFSTVQRVRRAARVLLIHSAVGATRRDFALAILADGLRNACIVGAVGVAASVVVARVLVGSSPDSIELVGRFGSLFVLSSPISLVLLGITAAGLIAVPFFVRLPTHPSGRGQAKRSSANWADLGWVLAAAQVATAVLIAACALLVAGAATSINQTAAVDPRGPDTMVLRAQLPDGASLLESWNAARHAAAELPDVEAFSISTPGAALGFGTADGGGAECRHCSFGGLGVPVTIGRARHMAVDEAFFLMLGSGLPHSMEPGKVLVNATLVREWFQDGEFIGRRLWIAGDAPFLGAAYRVADVVELAPPVGLGSALLPGPAVYGALEDFPPRRADILVRARADSSRSDVVVALLATLAKAIPGVSLESLGSLDDVAAEHAAPVRWLSSWILVFAAAALMFAVVGLGAAMMDRVRARTAEIGVQRAVGARRFHVLKGVLADSAGVVATGGVVGAALGASAGRGLSLLLGGISPPPVGILGGIVGLAGLVTIVGAVGASVWALNVDPVVALRDH